MCVCVYIIVFVFPHLLFCVRLCVCLCCVNSVSGQRISQRGLLFVSINSLVYTSTQLISLPVAMVLGLGIIFWRPLETVVCDLLSSVKLPGKRHTRV